jgi:hypothetical protein
VRGRSGIKNPPAGIPNPEIVGRLPYTGFGTNIASSDPTREAHENLEMLTKAITDGYDPMLGILHDQRHKEKERTPSFALDLMEPLRPVVDRAVLKLVKDETFSGVDFQLQSDGVCRLIPQFAANIVRITSATLRNQ